MHEPFQTLAEVSRKSAETAVACYSSRANNDGDVVGGFVAVKFGNRRRIGSGIFEEVSLAE